MKKNILKKLCLTVVACVVTAVTPTAVSAQESTDSDSLYAIASVSKMYVTAAAMQLSDRGLISIDNPVTDYIPEFEMADPRYKDITVRMLMDHTSGLMGTRNDNSVLYEDNDPYAHDSFLDGLKTQRLKADPGAFSSYSNDGFFLLEILVERVSGMDFTDYMEENIVKPLGGVKTGTRKNAFDSPFQAEVYDSNAQPFAHEYNIGIGAGGVLSTAPELCRFGSAFFKGDNTLLSEKAKERMSENESKDKYEGNYSLGWDDVDAYQGQGVKVLSKGGDLLSQHASLLVAPDEKISVAVCTSGGNSGVDELFAKCLMNIALSESGINITEIEPDEYTVSGSVPEEYSKYEGVYASGSSMYEVTFPDMSYMKVEDCGETEHNVTFYKYAENGQFVKMAGDVPNGSFVADSETQILSFREQPDGKIYILSDTKSDYPKLGSSCYSCYYAQKIAPCEAGKDAIDSWREHSGKYYVVSGKYSDQNYSFPAMEVKLLEKAEGYVCGCGVLAVKDGEHAEAFVEIPGHNGRDLTDMTAKDGYIKAESMGITFMKEDLIAPLSESVSEITFTERAAKWYVIGENTGGKVVSFDRSEHTSVYVYDKYDNCTYNTYMSGFDGRIPLPTEGKIVFVGEAGEKIQISQVQ